MLSRLDLRGRVRYLGLVFGHHEQWEFRVASPDSGESREHNFLVPGNVQRDHVSALSGPGEDSIEIETRTRFIALHDVTQLMMIYGVW
jgi:hypothetical protein